MLQPEHGPRPHSHALDHFHTQGESFWWCFSLSIALAITAMLWTIFILKVSHSGAASAWGSWSSPSLPCSGPYSYSRLVILVLLQPGHGPSPHCHALDHFHTQGESFWCCFSLSMVLALTAMLWTIFILKVSHSAAATALAWSSPSLPCSEPFSYSR